MLDKVGTSGSARVSIARSASAPPGTGRARAHEIAPAAPGHDVQDDRPRWQEAGSDKEPPEQDNGSGAAARQAIDEALKALLPASAPKTPLPEIAPNARGEQDATAAHGDVTGRWGTVAAPAQTMASPHSRAVGAYGLQSELQGRGAVLRPGAVFSARF